jgi:hypothetical protein
MGDHYVAVNPSDVRISYNDSDKKCHATKNATADQLKAASEFKVQRPMERQEVITADTPPASGIEKRP